MHLFYHIKTTPGVVLEGWGTYPQPQGLCFNFMLLTGELMANGAGC